MNNENSPEYYVHQAREFHKTAADAVGDLPMTIATVLTNLTIAVDYLIELEEAKLRHGWISL